MTFENGNTVSVQWGPGNYCSHYNTPHEKLKEATRSGKSWNSETAEVAAWEAGVDSSGGRIWHRFIEGVGDGVKGYLSADGVAEFIHFVANNKLETREWKYDYDLDEVVLVEEGE